MTILQRATFMGVEHNRARPGATVRKSDVETWLKDQAHVYENITGAAVPSAGSISATGHIHDGSNGTVIPIPLAQNGVPASLHRRSSQPTSGGVDYAGYQPFWWFPIFVPQGVTTVAVLLYVHNREVLPSLRCTTQNTSLTTINQQDGAEMFSSSSNPQSTTHWLYPGVDDPVVAGWIMSVNEGAVNLIKLEAWDGYYDQYGNATDGLASQLPQGRWIGGYSVIPLARPPVTASPAADPAITDDTRVKVPSSFTSFDSNLVANDRGVSSYLLVNAIKNDALLREVLTGRPAGNRSSATFVGHNHKDDAGTSLDSAGDDIDQPLGSWAYGSLRAPSGYSGLAAEYSYEDVPRGEGTFESVWDAASAPILSSTAVDGTYYDFFQHRVRVPAALTANLANSTGKLKLTALCYNDGNTVFVRASMGDSTGSSFDTTASASSTTDPRVCVTISGLECTRPEEINTLKIEVTRTTNKNHKVGLYGCCLYYEK